MPCPSVELDHFARARRASADPPDQALIPRPRLGYHGVVDERLDLGLLDAVAARRPDWQFVMIGPVAKVDPAELPHRRNIHWLGMRDYESLPEYLSGWDAAIMPFALNDATRFISPTKTLEYLAAGRPVISTGIGDVREPYGRLGLVSIAEGADEFVRHCEAAVRGPADTGWLARVDDYLQTTSWDQTWAQMDGELRRALAREGAPAGHV